MWPLGLSGFDVTRNTRALRKLERLESIYSKSIAESFEMALLSNNVVQRDVLGRSDGHGGVGINVRCCPTDGISDACAHQINSPKKTRQRFYLQKCSGRLRTMVYVYVFVDGSKMRVILI